jgi:HlyD family secretion protein/macrolide-specific efflux system membrane fusion protein
MAGAGWFFFLRGGKEEGPRIIETVTLNRGTVKKELESTGIIKSQVGAIVKIGAQATGKINKMLVKVGDRVQEGDLIALIDDREITAAVLEAEARLERTKADLAQVNAVFPLQIKEAEANVEAARAEANFQDTLLKRRQSLVDRGVISTNEFDDTSQAARVRANVLRARIATLNRLKSEFKKEREKAEKAVIEAEASLATSLTRKSYTRIIAPLTGVVSQVSAQEGETVVSGLQVSNLITILDPSRLEMWIYVDETDVGQMRPGMSVEFTVDAYPDDIFEGGIKQIYPEPEIRENIVYYLALVPVSPDQADKLRPEMTTQCRIVVERRDDVLAIPNRALKWVGGQQVVFVQNGDGTVKEVQPELGLSGLASSEVLSGLSEGDDVAVQVVLPGGAGGSEDSGGMGRGRRG